MDVVVEECLSAQSGIDDITGVGSIHGGYGVVFLDEDGARPLDHFRLQNGTSPDRTEFADGLASSRTLSTFRSTAVSRR